MQRPEQSVRLDEPVAGATAIFFPHRSLPTYVYAVPTAEGPCLVDTGLPGGGPGLVRCLEAAGLRPVRILLTHHHETHVAGVGDVVARFGAEVWVHEAEEALCRSLGLPVHRTFRDGERLAGELQAIHTPGHSPGHTAFFWEPQGVLFAGDAVFGLGPAPEQPLSLPPPFRPELAEQVRADVRRLLALPITACLPAHGRQVRQGGREALEELVRRTAG